jgi:hypothetical protein
MRPIPAVLLLAAAFAAAGNASACGVCIEDKIAAVYDHAAVTKALEAKHVVVFFAIEGAIPPGATGLRKTAAMAASAPGVDRDSVRISRDGASLAVSFDPRRGNLAKVQEILDRRLGATGLSLLAMRVMDSPCDLAAVRRPR